MKHNKLLLWEHLRVWLTTGTIITVQYSSEMLLTIPGKRMNLIRLSNSTFGTSIDQNANVTLPRFKVSSTESDLLAGRVFAFKSISRFPQMTVQCSIQPKCRFEISAQDINGWIMEVVRFSTLHIFTWYRSRYLTLPVHSSYDLLRLFALPEIAEGLIIFIRWKDTSLSSCSCTRIVTVTPASRRATDKDIWQYLDWSHVGGAVQRAKVRRRFTLIVFSPGRSAQRYSFSFPAPPAGCEPVTLTLGLLSPWVPGCRLGLPAAVLSLLWVNTEKKKKKWEHCDPQRRDQSLTGSDHSVGTYSQLQGIMGNWDISLFLLQSSLYLSAFLTLLSSLSFLSVIPLISHLFFLFTLSSLFLFSSSPAPSFTPYLNYFPFWLLSPCPSLLPSIRLSHLLILTVIPRFLS